jgi:hypothetical protein
MLASVGYRRHTSTVTQRCLWWCFGLCVLHRPVASGLSVILVVSRFSEAVLASPYSNDLSVRSCYVNPILSVEGSCRSPECPHLGKSRKSRRRALQYAFSFYIFSCGRRQQLSGLTGALHRRRVWRHRPRLAAAFPLRPSAQTALTSATPSRPSWLAAAIAPRSCCPAVPWFAYMA